MATIERIAKKLVLWTFVGAGLVILLSIMAIVLFVVVIATMDTIRVFELIK